MEITAAYAETFAPQPRLGLPRSEREEQVEKFLTALNPSRRAKGLRPYTAATLNARYFLGIPTRDLHAIFQKCASYKNFGAGFHHEFGKKP